MNRGTHKFASVVLLVTLFAGVVAPLHPAMAASPTEDLKQIEYKYYFRGKYQQAIEALQTYLARVDLPSADALRAREVLAASYVLGGASAVGQQIFAGMISANPKYKGPDPNVFKLEVVDAYAKARSDYAAMALASPPPLATDDNFGAGTAPSQATVAEAGKPIYKKWWFYAGAAALIAVVGVAAGGGGDDEGDRGDSGGVTVGVTVH